MLKHVQANEPFRPSATAWNAFVDTAKAAQIRHSGGGLRTPLGDADLITVRNASERDFDRFEVIGINGPVFDRDENADEFENNLTFEGTIPKTCHVGRFAILQDAIPAGEFGRAFLSGVAICQVDFGDGFNRTFADVQTGEVHLVANYIGSAQILWAADTTGKQWAIVRLGNNADAQLTSECSSSSFSSSSETSESASTSESESETSGSDSQSSTSTSGSSSGTSESTSSDDSSDSTSGSSSGTSESTSGSGSESGTSGGTSSGTTSATSSSSSSSESSSETLCVDVLDGIGLNDLPIGTPEYVLGLDLSGCLIRVPVASCDADSSSESTASSSTAGGGGGGGGSGSEPLSELPP